MIPTPNLGQRLDSVTVSPATLVPRHQAQESSRAPEPNEVLLIQREPPKDIPAVPIEAIKVRADLQLEEISLAFEGTATVASAGEEFTLDLSFMYFNVVVIGSDGSIRQLDSNGDNMSMSLGTGEIALLLSPGSRSSGTGYLEAVRRIAIEVAKLARHIVQPRSGEQAAAEVKAAQVSADRAALQTRTQQAMAQRHSSAQAATSVSSPPAKSAIPLNTAAGVVAKAFTSFAALAQVKPSELTESPKSSINVLRPEHHRPVHAHTKPVSKMAVDLNDKRRLHLVFDEAFMRGELHVTREMLADSAHQSRGYFDHTV